MIETLLDAWAHFRVAFDSLGIPRLLWIFYWSTTLLFAFIVPLFLGGTLTLRQWYIRNIHRLFEYCDSIIKERKHLLGFDYEEETPEELEKDHQYKRRHLPSYVAEEDGEKEKSFRFGDIAPLVMSGVCSINDDEVMKRFNASNEHKLWNMLTRTSIHPVFMSHRLNAIWALSFVWRWCWLLPLRVMVFMFSICWLIFATLILMIIPKSVSWYDTAYEWMMKLFFRLITHSFSAVINFHYPENKAKKGGICVANHTSPLDAVILSYDNCYSLIGQRHGGFLGFIMTILDQTCSHIWFERHESKDRQMVIDRLQAHCSNKESRPVLIFPEGTCINNTSVMMFKKGSFEIDTIIYPVAIKYNTLYTEAFWNSSEQSIVRYLFMMLTSWALVCNVWYLPAMRKEPNEDAITFANRVKSLIATQGGLVDLQWDGMIKRKQLSQKIKESLMDRERREFLAQSNYLPRTLSSGNLLANLQAAHAASNNSNNFNSNNLQGSKSAHNLQSVIDSESS